MHLILRAKKKKNCRPGNHYPKNCKKVADCNPKHYISIKQTYKSCIYIYIYIYKHIIYIKRCSTLGILDTPAAKFGETEYEYYLPHFFSWYAWSSSISPHRLSFEIILLCWLKQHNCSCIKKKKRRERGRLRKVKRRDCVILGITNNLRLFKLLSIAGAIMRVVKKKKKLPFCNNCVIPLFSNLFSVIFL